MGTDRAAFIDDTRGMPRVDDRRVLSGIVHALKSGGRWSDCPEHVYGPKKTLYNRFRRWAERGIWERIFGDLSGIEGVPSRLFIDSSCIKIHRTAGGAKGEPGLMVSARLKGENTKLHAVCDDKGRPHVLLLTPGNTHDAKVAMLAINAVPASDYLVADKGYDSNAIRKWLIERGTTPVIPAKSNRKVHIEHDRQINGQRNVVERMFCRFKDWRRVATRYDRNVKTFMVSIHRRT